MLGAFERTSRSIVQTPTPDRDLEEGLRRAEEPDAHEPDLVHHPFVIGEGPSLTPRPGPEIGATFVGRGFVIAGLVGAALTLLAVLAVRAAARTCPPGVNCEGPALFTVVLLWMALPACVVVSLVGVLIIDHAKEREREQKRKADAASARSALP
jgi:hypothetical protein